MPMGFYPNMCPLPVGLEGAFAKDTKKIGGLLFGSHPSLARSPGHTPARVAVAPRPLRDRFGESRGSSIVELEDRPRRELASFPKRIGSIVCLSRQSYPRRTSRAMLPSMVRRYAAARRKQTRSQRLRARYARTDGPPVSLARSRSQSASRSRGDPRAPRRFDPPAFANDAFGAFDKFRILTPPPTGRNCSSSPPL